MKIISATQFLEYYSEAIEEVEYSSLMPCKYPPVHTDYELELSFHKSNFVFNFAEDHAQISVQTRLSFHTVMKMSRGKIYVSTKDLDQGLIQFGSMKEVGVSVYNYQFSILYDLAGLHGISSVSAEHLQFSEGQYDAVLELLSTTREMTSNETSKYEALVDKIWDQSGLSIDRVPSHYWRTKANVICFENSLSSRDLMMLRDLSSECVLKMIVMYHRVKMLPVDAYSRVDLARFVRHANHEMYPVGFSELLNQFSVCNRVFNSRWGSSSLKRNVDGGLFSGERKAVRILSYLSGEGNRIKERAHEGLKGSLPYIIVSTVPFDPTVHRVKSRTGHTLSGGPMVVCRTPKFNLSDVKSQKSVKEMIEYNSSQIKLLSRVGNVNRYDKMDVVYSKPVKIRLVPNVIHRISEFGTNVVSSGQVQNRGTQVDVVDSYGNASHFYSVSDALIGSHVNRDVPYVRLPSSVGGGSASGLDTD